MQHFQFAWDMGLGTELAWQLQPSMFAQSDIGHRMNWTSHRLEHIRVMPGVTPGAVSWETPQLDL